MGARDDRALGLSEAEPPFERGFAGRVPAALARAGDNRDRYAGPHAPPAHPRHAARGPCSRGRAAKPVATGRAGCGGATSDPAVGSGPGGGDLPHRSSGVARPATGRAEAAAPERWRGPDDRGGRLRCEEQHPAVAARAGLPGHRAAAHSRLVRCRGHRSRRSRSFKRPWRPLRLGRACRARAPGPRTDSAVRHLPRPPDPRHGRRRHHVTPALWPSRRQPPRQGPRDRHGSHHEPEPRVPDRCRFHSRRRPRRDAAQLERRLRRGACAQGAACFQRPVPPRGLPGSAGQPASLRPVP